jgi:PAS domain S-box-containing protein
MADADGHIFWYNRRWYEYTGTTPEAVLGWGWQSVHDPEVLPKVVERWKASIATGKSFEMVFPLRGADAVFRPFLTRIVPVRDSSGAIARWFGTNTDIDEQKRTEDALRQANRSLEEFAYVASHDLQEPLRMVNVYSQLLLKRLGPETNPQLQQYAEYVRTGIKRMEELIHDLLTYSRVTYADQRSDTARANLEAVLRQAMINVDARAGEPCGSELRSAAGRDWRRGTARARFSEFAFERAEIPQTGGEPAHSYRGRAAGWALGRACERQRNRIRAGPGGTHFRPFQTAAPG